MGQQMNDDYGLQLNLDHIIAASLLHDVDKIIFFEGIGDKARHGKLEEYFVHGPYGAHFALQAGVHREVVHVIMTHSSSVKEDPKSPEGILITFADLGKLHALKAVQGKDS
jgi:HD superfamily phosphodiesterase